MANLVTGIISQLTALQKWLRIDPLNRPRVYEQVYDTADFTNLQYWLGIVFSAGKYPKSIPSSKITNRGPEFGPLKLL